MNEDPDDLAAAFFAAQAAKEQQKAKLPTEDWINAITTMQSVMCAGHHVVGADDVGTPNLSSNDAASWLMTTIPTVPDQGVGGMVGIELNSKECHSFNLFPRDGGIKSGPASKNDVETAKEKLKQFLVQKLMHECN